MADEPGITPASTDADDDTTGGADTDTALTDDKNLDPGGKPLDDDTPGKDDEPGKESDDDKKSDDADDDKSTNEPPETYADFELPEGVELDVSMLEAAAPVFKELGLSQEQAQKLISFQADQVQAGEVARAEAFTQLKQDWIDAAKADSEFGGDAFSENIKLGQAAVASFGSPELVTLLNQYGIGNHPEMIRFMVKVGKLTAEDVPGKTGGSVAETKDHAEMLYPDTT